MNKHHFTAHHIGVRLQSFGPDQVIGQCALGLTQEVNITVAEGKRHGGPGNLPYNAGGLSVVFLLTGEIKAQPDLIT